MNETTIPDTPQDAAAVGAQLVRDVRPCARYPHLATRAELEDEIDRLRGLLEQAAVDLVRADMARVQIVAAERERLRALVQAVRDANAAEAHGDYPFRVLTARQDRAWVELMAGLEGPNVF
jgi:hypothetical protein